MAKTPKQPKVEDIVRKHETDKCDLCVKPAVIRVTFFGEVQEYVGADGDWRDYVEDTEGYEIYRCVAHAKKGHKSTLDGVVDTVLEENEEQDK